MSVCLSTPEDLKPQVGGVTVSEVSWDSFLVSWVTERGAFENFLIEVESEDGEQMRNVTVSGGETSQVLTELLPGTLYKVTLYGLYKWNLIGPVFAEATTGINVRSFVCSFVVSHLSLLTIVVF